METNNQLVQLAEEEAAEIVRILRELTERLQRLRMPLIAAAETIGELDSMFARARFARDFDAAMPEFTAQSELRLQAARHPVLEDKLRREDRAIVPMSLALGGDERVLVISGPNTGGEDRGAEDNWHSGSVRAIGHSHCGPTRGAAAL